MHLVPVIGIQCVNMTTTKAAIIETLSEVTKITRADETLSKVTKTACAGECRHSSQMMNPVLKEIKCILKNYEFVFSYKILRNFNNQMFSREQVADEFLDIKIHAKNKRFRREYSKLVREMQLSGHYNTKRTKRFSRHLKQRRIEEGHEQGWFSVDVGLDQQTQDLVDSALGTIKEVAASVGGVANTIVQRVQTLLIAFANVTMAKPTFRLMSLAMNLYHVISSFNPDLDIISSAKKILDNLRTFIGKMYEEISEPREQNFELVGNIPEQAVKALLSLFGIVLTTILCVNFDSTTTLAKLVDHCGKLGRSVKGIEQLFEVFGSTADKIIGWVKENLFGTPMGSEELAKFESTFPAWMSRVQTISSRYQEDKESFMEAAKRDIVKAKEIEMLYTQGLGFLQSFNSLKLHPRVTLPFTTTFGVIRALKTEVNKSGVFNSGARKEPLLVYIYGKPGVGKSCALWNLSIDLLRKKNMEKSWKEQVYSRNVEQEFWDGYRNQMICLYDDAFQMKDNVNTPNPEVFEVIRTGNIAQYNLHMASLEEKATTKFSSEIVMFSSNCQIPLIKSVNDEVAVFRRFDLYIEQYVAPEYTKGMYDPRFDARKIPQQYQQSGKSFTGAYRFNIINPLENFRVVKEDVTYEELVSYASHLYDNKMKYNDFIIGSLDKYAGDEKTIISNNIMTDPIVEAAEEQVLGRIVDWARHQFSQAKDTFDYYRYPEEEYHNYLVCDQLGISRMYYDWWLDDGQYFKIKSLTAIPHHDAFINYAIELKTEQADPSFEQFVRSQVMSFPYMTIELIPDESAVTYTDLIKCEIVKVIDYVKNHPIQVFGGLLGLALTMYLGVKLFKSINDTTSVMEGNPSGEVTTMRPRVKVEGNTSGDVVTSKPRISVEGNGSGDVVTTKSKIVVEGTDADENVRLIFSAMTPEEFSDWKNFQFDVDGLVNLRKISISNNKYDFKTFCKFYAIHMYCQQNNIDNIFAQRRVVKDEGNASGDVVTLQRRAVMEGNSSGDLVTCRKVVKVESTETPSSPMISGVQNINHDDLPADGIDYRHSHECVICQTRFWHKHSASNNHRKRGLACIDCSNIAVDAQGTADENLYLMILNRVMSNVYRIYVRNVDDGVISERFVMNGTFLRGRIMITATHILPHLVGDFVVLRNACGVEFIVSTDDIQARYIRHYSTNEIRQTILLEFPNSVTSHSDIQKYITTAEDLGRFKTADGCLYTVIQGTNKRAAICPYVQHVKADAIDLLKVSSASGDGTTTMYRELYKYRATTKGGYCGSPLFINSSKVSNKLLGIHVAGVESDDKGFSERLRIDEIEKAMLNCSAFAQVYVDPSDNPLIKEHHLVLPELNEGGEIDVQPLVVHLGMQSVGHTVRLNRPTESVVVPSVIHGSAYEVTMAPCPLKNVTVDGRTFDPLIEGLKKVAVNSPYVESDVIQTAIASVKAHLYENTNARRQQVYNDEIACFGDPEDKYIEPINRKTSPGFDYVLARKSPGKRDYLGEGNDKFYSPKLKADVDARIERASKGIRTPVLYTDTLKDEKRPIAKVLAGKTRVFTVGTLDHTIAVRKYFSGVIAHLMENRITNEIAVGIDPKSAEWHQLALFLKSGGHSMVAGDFSNFDGSLTQVFLEGVFECLDGFYGNDGNRLIRYVLFQEIINSLHVTMGLDERGMPKTTMVCGWTHSQTSGNPITTIINCLINLLVFRCAFIKAGLPIKRFRELVTLTSYGDDNVAGIHPSIQDVFNQHTITKFFAELGFTYTDESKSDRVVAPVRPLEEISFLKRGFIYNKALQRTTAPLELSVIKEMVNWVKTDLDKETQTKITIETALDELWLHGQSVYDEVSSVFSDAFRKNTGNGLTVYPYSTFIDEQLLKDIGSNATGPNTKISAVNKRCDVKVRKRVLVLDDGSSI